MDTAPILMVGSEWRLRSLFAPFPSFDGRAVDQVLSLAEAEAHLDSRAYTLVICHSDTYAEGGAQFVWRTHHRRPQAACVFVDNARDASSLLPLLQPTAKPHLPGVLEKLRSIVPQVDKRDPMNEHHSPRVAQASVRLGEAVGLGTSELISLEAAALLHDLGKMGVPSAVLSKPSSLNPDEWQLMRRHPALGAEMLRRVGVGEDILAIVRHHHERCDGHGYPDGLAREEIPLGARIVALADAFVAMTARRSYRPALEERVAMDQIAAGLGSQFDPVIGETFLCLNSTS